MLKLGLRDSRHYVLCFVAVILLELSHIHFVKAYGADSADVIKLELLRGGVEQIAVNTGKAKNANIVLDVVESPNEGVLVIKYNTACANGEVACVNYRHGGSSMLRDTFSYRVLLDGKHLKELDKKVIVDFRAARAKVAILSPKQGQLITGGRVVVKYELSGADYDHLHISIDGTGHNTIRNLTGEYILENVPEGKHHIVAQLVDSNHRMVAVGSAKHTVAITTQN